MNVYSCILAQKSLLVYSLFSLLPIKRLIIHRLTACFPRNHAENKPSGRQYQREKQEVIPCRRFMYKHCAWSVEPDPPCLECGLEPRFEAYHGTEDSLLSFVVSLNLQRRHLTSSQKAVIALEIEKYIAANTHMGRPAQNEKLVKDLTNSSPNENKSAQQAAAIVGSNRQYVSDAKRIASDAPELLPMIKDGSLSLPEAKRLSSQPEDRRAAAIAAIDCGEAKNVKEAITVVNRNARTAVPADLPPVSERCSLYEQDFRVCMPALPEASVDVVITDP